MKMTRRVKVHTGLRCNAKCRFCYYWDKLDSPNPSSEEIKAKLRYAKKHGIEDIDFSGGEPTIRADFPELVSYASQLGFRYICVITNGIRMSNKEYVDKLVEAGLNDTLFSLEGHTAKVHDDLTQVPGSFERIMKSIQNAKENEVKVRTNATVTRENFKYIPHLANLLAEIKPEAVNFILFNDWCSAHKKIREMSCKYSEASPYLKEAIDTLDPIIKKITVRYTPFCFMVGYEKYVCNLLQKKYDPDEWDDYVKTRILSDVNHNKNIRLDRLRSIRYLLRNIYHSPYTFVRSRFKLHEMLHDLVIEQMRKGYSKSQECKKCKYFYICDGLENSYANEVGFSEINSVSGLQIRDPLYHRRMYVSPA